MLCREHQPSFAVMPPVSAVYVLSWRRNISRCRSHRSLSPCHPLCLSPHWSFISNRAQGLQFNPNTSLSPSFSLKCTLKAPFSESTPSPDILGHLFTPFLCFLSAILSLHAHTPLYRGLCSLLGGWGGDTGSTMGLQWQFHARFSWTGAPSEVCIWK